MIPAASGITHEHGAWGEPWAATGCISDFPSHACKLGLELMEKGGQMDTPEKVSGQGHNPLSGVRVTARTAREWCRGAMQAAFERGCKLLHPCDPPGKAGP